MSNHRPPASAGTATTAGNMLAIGLAFAAPCAVQAQSLDLSRYQVSATYSAGVNEASGITYNWDTDTLMIIGDGVNLSEMTRTGAIASYPLMGTSGGNASFKDTEGIAYVGNGKYLVADERTNSVSLISPDGSFTMPGGLLRTYYTDKPSSPTYFFNDVPIIGNLDMEGVSYERSTGTVFTVKELRDKGVYQAQIQFGDSTATTTGTHFQPFSGEALGLASLSDISVLSNVSAFAGSSFADNLLILSAGSQRLIEVTRSGQIVSSLNLAGMATKIEGVTLDNLGNIYLVAEGGGPGGGTALVVLSAVPEPSAYAFMLAGLGGLAAVLRRRRNR